MFFYTSEKVTKQVECDEGVREAVCGEHSTHHFNGRCRCSSAGYFDLKPLGPGINHNKEHFSLEWPGIVGVQP